MTFSDVAGTDLSRILASCRTERLEAVSQYSLPEVGKKYSAIIPRIYPNLSGFRPKKPDPEAPGQQALKMAEELMVRAPPPRLPTLVARRRLPAVARQRARVSAEKPTVRAPPPRPPNLVAWRRQPAVARQWAWVLAEMLAVRAPPWPPPPLVARRPPPAVAHLRASAVSQELPVQALPLSLPETLLMHPTVGVKSSTAKVKTWFAREKRSTEAFTRGRASSLALRTGCSQSVVMHTYT